MKKDTFSKVLLGILILFLSIPFTIPKANASFPYKIGINEAVSLVNHEPIYIEGESDLQAYFAGNSTMDGTESKPYIIQNLKIQGDNNNPAIYINNTKSFILIQNCEVYGNYNNSVLFGGVICIGSSQNVTVIDNLVHDGYFGIRLRNTNSSKVIGNNFYNMDNLAILVDGDGKYNKYNMAYLNNVSNGGVWDHSGGQNRYDNGTIGNYWGDTYFDSRSSATSIDGVTWNETVDIGGSLDTKPIAYLSAPVWENDSGIVNESSFKVQWKESRVAESYKVYVNGTLNSTLTTNEFVVNVKQDANYTISVSQVRGAYESDRSAEITIQVKISPVTNSGIPGYDVALIIFTLGVSVFILVKKYKIHN